MRKKKGRGFHAGRGSLLQQLAQHEVVGDACRKMAKRSSCSSAASRAHGNGAAANLATGIAAGPLPPNFPPGGYIGVLSSFLVHVFFFCFFYKVEKTCTITMGSILIDLLWTPILQPTLPTGIAADTAAQLPTRWLYWGTFFILVHVFFFVFSIRLRKFFFVFSIRLRKRAPKFHVHQSWPL